VLPSGPAPARSGAGKRSLLGALTPPCSPSLASSPEEPAFEATPLPGPRMQPGTGSLGRRFPRVPPPPHNQVSLLMAKRICPAVAR